MTVKSLNNTNENSQTSEKQLVSHERVKELEDLAYERGRKAFASSLLRQIVPNLDKSDQQVAYMTAERAEIVSSLRILCAEFGDNDWHDALHLSDVINKHLIHYLRNNR